MRTQAEIEKELKTLVIHLYFSAINNNLIKFCIYMEQAHILKEELEQCIGIEQAIEVYRKHIMHILTHLLLLRVC